MRNSADARQRPLWACPRCGNKFVTKNLWHSCGKYSLKELFAGSDPHVLRLFRKFEKMALPRKVHHPKLVKYDHYASHFQGHLFRIESEKDFGRNFRTWLRESYRVGTQEALKRTKAIA